MTVCPKCNGRGTVGYFHIDHFVDIECDRCNGSGEISEVEMTNEEYLKSLDTEQLAEWMAKEKLCNCYFIFPSMEEAIQDAMEWLKQPHQLTTK